MNSFKLMLLGATAVGLFACTIHKKETTKPAQVGYLKDNISQAELDNPSQYKRYYYQCRNLESGSYSSLTSYFPLSRESRKKENFGFYFQLDGGKAEPFDHIENKKLNARGTRFEVVYRSYRPIQGSQIELIARNQNSIYYKNSQGTRRAWLSCREG